VNWGSRYEQQQGAAAQALLAATGAVSSSLATFTGWLLAVSGASFAFIAAHANVVLAHVSAFSFRLALVLFAASLLFGLLARWLGATTLGALAAISSMAARGSNMAPLRGFKLLAFTKFFAGACLPVYRPYAWHGYKQVKGGNSMAGVSKVVRRSQWQAILSFAHLVFVFLSVLVLALGVQA
jgi:hypothetical protein